MFCVFFHNSEIMDTNGPTNKKAVLSNRVLRPGQCGFYKMQMPLAQGHITAGDGLGLGVWITVWDFSHVARDVKTQIPLHHLQVGHKSDPGGEEALDWLRAFHD